MPSLVGGYYPLIEVIKDLGLTALPNTFSKNFFSVNQGLLVRLSQFFLLIIEKVCSQLKRTKFSFLSWHSCCREALCERLLV